MSDENYRVESELEVKSYLQNLQYALRNGGRIYFQEHRLVDVGRNERYTNKYTIAHLFPREDVINAIKRELLSLGTKDYIRTVKDIRFPQRSEMREFGKVYDVDQEVYIKIRVEVLGEYGSTTVFVMSFHYAEKPFYEEIFPYKGGR